MGAWGGMHTRTAAAHRLRTKPPQLPPRTAPPSHRRERGSSLCRQRLARRSHLRTLGKLSRATGWVNAQGRTTEPDAGAPQGQAPPRTFFWRRCGTRGGTHPRVNVSSVRLQHMFVIASSRASALHAPQSPCTVCRGWRRHRCRQAVSESLARRARACEAGHSWTAASHCAQSCCAAVAAMRKPGRHRAKGAVPRAPAAPCLRAAAS